MGRGIKSLFGGGKASALPYKGAAPSRSKSDWITTSAGPNATVEAALPILLSRHRDGARNDPHVKRMESIYVHALVGTGCMATAVHDNSDAGKRLAAAADAVWKAVNKRGVLDIMGIHTGESLQAQMARELMAGQVLIRRVWDRTAPIVPFRVQLLEGDMLDTTITRDTEDGGRIRCGIELDRMGRVLAYWIRTEHPGESWITSRSSVRVPLSDCVHLKLPGRPGQLQSVPITTPVMATKKDLADFEAFTLIQKKTESLVVGVVTRQPYDEYNPAPEPGQPELDENGKEVEPDVIVPGVVNTEGELVGTMSPGQWLGVDEGVDVRFNQPQLAANYGDFKKSHLQSFAAGTNLSYEQASGDFSGANYSTMRGGKLEFWAAVDSILWNELIPALDVVWGWVMEGAWMVGRLDTPEVEADWQPPARPSIEPDKDAIANMIQVRAGWLDEDDVIKANGYHPEKLRKKLKANREQRELYSIISDADPSKYAWRGSFPPAVQATPLADELPDGADPGA